MRLLGVLFASLTVLCLLCAPVLAQSSPSPSQYEPGTCPAPPCDSVVQDVGESADDFAENAEQGAAAVNEAMGEPGASPSADASAPAGSVPHGDASAGAEAGGSNEITRLPETGGAPLTALGYGVLLVGCGLMARGLARR